MRLSTAILLGRHTIEKCVAGEIGACAIPMALNSVGRKPFGAPHGDPLEKTTLQQLERLPNNDYHQLIEEWQWLMFSHPDCPVCNVPLNGTQIVFHVFDYHVMAGFNGTITIEQMCDWLRTIEPAEADEPQTATEVVAGKELITV